MKKLLESNHFFHENGYIRKKSRYFRKEIFSMWNETKIGLQILSIYFFKIYSEKRMSLIKY